VLLFDEIEKAHRDVFNVFLQILDEGHITDSKGRKVNFKNTIIIFTSNLLSEMFSEEAMPAEKSMRENLSQYFRPEFLNRLDEIVGFHPLGKTHIDKILNLQLEALTKRLKANQGITLELTDSAKDYLAETGFDPAFGARPLKRAIERELLNPMALKLLEVGDKNGLTIKVESADGGLVFK
jgi:ATP-dependent Clp protease ATP-binding subunit ClpB